MEGIAMSKIKSFSVSDGDLFYIEHSQDSFTIIDCNLISERKDIIINELKRVKKGKTIFRFISTHPDDDHIKGIEDINRTLDINNFYCVENKVTRSDKSQSFECYCKLRDGNNKCFLKKGIQRCYLNKDGETEEKKINSSGINVLWPNTDNNDFRLALKDAEENGHFNNISPIIKYTSSDGISFLWFGDLESEFMEKIKDELISSLSHVNVLFAPHHGRKTGRIPNDVLKVLSPNLIVVGEANSEELDYYHDYNHINQNTLKDILLVTSESGLDIFATKYHSYDFLEDLKKDVDGLVYIGTLVLKD